MGSMNFVNSAIEKKLMDLHCGYIGKVIWTDGVTAKVQPLGLMKENDGVAKTQAVVSDVPVACRYKIKEQTITYLVSADGERNSQKIAVPIQIEKGDLVACICADRDITDARRGGNSLPPAGRHSISDSIIVGIL